MDKFATLGSTAFFGSRLFLPKKKEIGSGILFYFFGVWIYASICLGVFVAIFFLFTPLGDGGREGGVYSFKRKEKKAAKLGG